MTEPAMLKEQDVVGRRKGKRETRPTHKRLTILPSNSFGLLINNLSHVARHCRFPSSSAMVRNQISLTLRIRSRISRNSGGDSLTRGCLSSRARTSSKNRLGRFSSTCSGPNKICNVRTEGGPEGKGGGPSLGFLACGAESATAAEGGGVGGRGLPAGSNAVLTRSRSDESSMPDTLGRVCGLSRCTLDGPLRARGLGEMGECGDETDKSMIWSAGGVLDSEMRLIGSLQVRVSAFEVVKA